MYICLQVTLIKMIKNNIVEISIEFTGATFSKKKKKKSHNTSIIPTVFYLT
jgi:hypothetical protein